jgi:hypothetical protein
MTYNRVLRPSRLSANGFCSAGADLPRRLCPSLAGGLRLVLRGVDRNQRPDLSQSAFQPADSKQQ